MKFQEQLTESISKNGISTYEVTKGLLDKQLSEMSRKFTFSKDEYPLWMYLSEKVSVVNKNAWSWLAELVCNSEVLMIYHSDTEKFCFVFEKGMDLQLVLADFLPKINEFFNVYSIYITNKQLDYLLCLNHSDVIYASGDAVSRLEKYNNIKYNLGLRTLSNVFSILDIKAAELSIEKKQNTLEQLVHKFGNNKMYSPLWKGMVSNASAFDSQTTLSLMEKFIGDTKAIVFFDEDEEEDVGFIFDSSRELQEYLNEAPWGEVYITNEKTEYLICVNQYSQLLTWGSADIWFNRLQE
ncbi:hypothetical protein NDS46_16175 [Paenibacillus thiaminolyticus]|jgi:hypothetical protein|uniref:hypothetical protein n=1 Tax=Paenibacillus thiaminolyticus TaxID=49283 RepID=UPI0023313178|nr:hypothetical protein [Paenibacillus thiaminolyticus]WCF05915.1 hypothetical protein NDS46_16175 [Paenibacillus thiaminolyticus]